MKIDNNLKLNIIKIIKKEQLKIISILEDSYIQKCNFIDYEDKLLEADENTKKLVEQIEQKSQYFKKEVSSEDEMLELFDRFFEDINPLIDNILTHYKLYKSTNFQENYTVPHNVSVLIIINILNDYINFLTKMEGAILGLYNKDIILKIDVDEHICIGQYFQANSNKSIFMPILTSFGVGYLFGNL